MGQTFSHSSGELLYCGELCWLRGVGEPPSVEPASESSNQKSVAQVDTRAMHDLLPILAFSSSDSTVKNVFLTTNFKPSSGQQIPGCCTSGRLAMGRCMLNDWCVSSAAKAAAPIQ